MALVFYRRGVLVTNFIRQVLAISGTGLILALVFGLLYGSWTTVQAAEVEHGAVPMLNVNLGTVNVLNGEKSTRVGIDYRFRPLGDWRLVPALGAEVSDDGAYFIRADLRRDFWLDERWVLTPSFGLGVFEDGRKLHLGNTLEFRSGLELGYRFYREYRIGVAFYHISNAGIGKNNPGTEALVGSLCIPLGD